MRASRIATPLDFEPFVDCQDFTQAWLVRPAPTVESELRAVVAGLLDDLPYISASDRRLVTAYLQNIEEPLHDLQRLGFQLFGIQTQGTFKTSHGDIPGWRRAHFILASNSCYFRPEKGSVVHSLDSACAEGIRRLHEALTSGAKIAGWPSVDLVRTDDKRNVPWCPSCCLDEAAGIA